MRNVQRLQRLQRLRRLGRRPPGAAHDARATGDGVGWMRRACLHRNAGCREPLAIAAASRAGLAWAALALLVSGTAHANSGVGFFMLGLPLIVAALLPAIVIEALVYQPMLGLQFRPAIKLSTWANLASTAWGVGLGIGADVVLLSLTGSSGAAPTRGVMLAMLLPFLILSWRIERRSVAKRLPEVSRRSVEMATGVANLVTYACIAFALAFLGSGTPFASARTVVTTAILSATPLRAEVNAHWQATRSFPAPRAAAAPFANAPARVGLAARGRIVVLVDAPELARIHGKTIELVPETISEAGQDRGLRWSCRAPDIEKRFLPLRCR